MQMIKTQNINLRSVPEPVVDRIKALAKKRGVRYSVIIGRAIGALDGKTACRGCGVLKEMDDHTADCKIKD